MMIHVSDSQVVGETTSTMFQVVQQSPIKFALFIRNAGVNTLNYRLQEFNGAAWTDMGAMGTDYYTTLMAGETKMVSVESGYPQIQMVANASGGAYLEFSVTRFANRISGGTLPILNL